MIFLKKGDDYRNQLNILNYFLLLHLEIN